MASTIGCRMALKQYLTSILTGILASPGARLVYQIRNSHFWASAFRFGPHSRPISRENRPFGLDRRFYRRLHRHLQQRLHHDVSLAPWLPLFFAVAVIFSSSVCSLSMIDTVVEFGRHPANRHYWPRYGCGAQIVGAPDSRSNRKTRFFGSPSHEPSPGWLTTLAQSISSLTSLPRINWSQPIYDRCS